MKRRILYPIYMLALLFMSGACQEEDWKGGQTAHPDCLTLSVSTMASSRAEAGEDRFNENTITRADVYFFSSNDQNAQCLYAAQNVSVNSNTLQVELDKNVITDGNSYYIYVVANYDLLNSSVATDKTLADLKATVLTTPWKDGYSGNDGPETSLAMDGATTVTISSEGTTGHVDLKRAMAKVMLFPTAASQIIVGEGDEAITYQPALDQMKVTMVYGVNKTNFAGTYAVDANNDYIVRMLRNYTVTEGVYEQTAPFYSYPNPEGTTDRKDSYLILCVPWYVSTQTSQQAVNYYYRVPITGDDSPALLECNKYYEIHAHIGVLGSLNPHDAVTVESTFLIQDWFTMSIDASMQNYRYLVLDEYTSVMNNVDELRMPYVSSSDIAWENNPAPDGNYTKITSVRYWDYHNDESYEVTLTPQYTYDTRNNNHPVIFSDFVLESGNDGTLCIRHSLDDDDDFVPYVITVEVYNTQGVHTDTWEITQYPAMYIIGENNEDGGSSNRFINGYHEIGDNVYDDSGNRRDDDHYLGVVSDLSGTNSNPNLYTIHITSFDADEYAIGDPRNESYYSFGSDLDATEYRNTRVDAEDVVAPVYKVASSWGKTLEATYEGTLKRCASYQEAGYPAGRWRIPTKAEVEYIVTLSQAGKIPRLFGQQGSTTNYWVSSGKYNTSNGYSSGISGSAYVRCVYDVWYWGDKTIEVDEHNTSGLTNNMFVWGDAEDGSLRRGTEH